MNVLLLVVAAVAAVNAPRARAALPGDEPLVVGALGAVLTVAPLAVVAVCAHRLVDGLDLTIPTVRMAAGAVLAVQGLVSMASRLPAQEPRLVGRRAALVPVAFPVLLTPGLGLLALSGSLDRGAPVTIGAVALGLATLPALAAAYPSRATPAGDRAARAVAVVLAAILVVAGVGLIAGGIFDL